MLISLSRRFVFIASSKTASTSFESALDHCAEIRSRGGAAVKHATWVDVRNQYDFLFESAKYPPETFFRFGIVRDPVQWFVSWYNYRFGERLRPDQPADMTIEDFWKLDDWVKFRKDGSKRLQKDHFVEADGSCHFDMVMPMDMLHEYLPLLFARLGVSASLPQENRSRKLVSAADLAPELVAEMREFWKEDYAFIEAMRERVRTVLCPVQVVVSDVIPGVLAHVRLETGELPLVVGTPLALRGVAVPAPTLPATARLLARRGGVELPAVSGLRSPGMAKRFPAIPRAGESRFQVDLEPLTAGERVDLVLALPDGAERVVASLVADPALPPVAQAEERSASAGTKTAPPQKKRQ